MNSYTAKHHDNPTIKGWNTCAGNSNWRDWHMQKNIKGVVALSHQPCNLTIKRLIGSSPGRKILPKIVGGR